MRRCENDKLMKAGLEKEKMSHNEKKWQSEMKRERFRKNEV